MKLSVGDIKFSESYASTTVEVETGTYPFLNLSICTMDVSVPLVEGRALEQYKEELLAKARERIDSMYKEIICGGEINDAIDIIVCGKLNGEYKIRVVNKNGKLSAVGAEDGSSDDDLEKRVASIEKQLSGSLGTGALNAIYEMGKNAATDVLSRQKKRPKEEALDNFLKRFILARDHFTAHPFKGFHEAIKHDVEGVPGVLNPIPVSIEINANSVPAMLVPASSGVFRHERNDTEGSFAKIGPFNLQIQR